MPLHGGDLKIETGRQVRRHFLLVRRIYIAHLLRCGSRSYSSPYVAYVFSSDLPRLVSGLSIFAYARILKALTYVMFLSQFLYRSLVFLFPPVFARLPEGL